MYCLHSMEVLECEMQDKAFKELFLPPAIRILNT